MPLTGQNRNRHKLGRVVKSRHSGESRNPGALMTKYVHIVMTILDSRLRGNDEKMHLRTRPTVDPLSFR